MNEQEKMETVDRLKANRRNINFVNSNLNPDDWIRRTLKDVNKVELTRIIDDLEHPIPPPPDIHICKYPLDEVGKVNGWSGFGYESLPMKYVDPYFTEELWTECSDLLAKNAVNFIRFFASITESQEYINSAYHPVARVFDPEDMINEEKWDCLEMDPVYIAKISPRLDDLHDRKVTTEVTFGSGIKGVANRWDHSYFNGKNNINGTTTDLARFYDDERTMEVFRTALQNYAITFNSPYFKIRLLNEPNVAIGRLIKWNDYMIKGLDDVGIPRNRIMIQYFNDHRICDYLDRDVWVAVHGINSERTVAKWFQSGERRPLLLHPHFLLCGDGGDEFGGAEGLVGLGHDPDYRKAAARQERNMVRINLQNGGTGIDFMPALAFIDGKIPNLQRIVDHGEAGFSASELATLSNKLGVFLDPELNRYGELKEVRAGFVNNL